MSNFKTFVDMEPLRLAMGDKKEIIFSGDIPMFLEKCYTGIMDYIKLDKEDYRPEIMIKMGERTEAIYFEHNNCEGRILVNLGPNDAFKISKVLSKSNRMFDEIALDHFWGQVLGENYREHDIILSGNPRREVWIHEARVGRNLKPYLHKLKMLKIRKSDHVSIVMVINLWKIEKKEEKVVDGPARIVIDTEEEEKGYSDVVSRI